MIEAIYQSNMGKKVLMVDEENSVGGAWKSLNIFNFKDVENAIHYLLPNKKAIKFLEEVIKIDISKPQNKKFAFCVNKLSFCMKYDSIFSRFLFYLLSNTEKSSRIFSLFFKDNSSNYFKKVHLN